MIRLLLTVIVGLGIGCRDTKESALSSKDLPVALTFQKFSAGKKVSERPINKGTLEYAQLGQWLDANRDSWARSYTSFVPVAIIRADGFSLNFVPGKVVLNRWSKDKDPEGQLVLESSTFPTFLSLP